MSSNSTISQAELIINVTIWICAILYSIYCFTTSSNTYFRYYDDDYSDFAQGWSFLSRRKDVGDDDWRIFKFMISKLSLWVIASTIVSEILRRFKLIQVLLIWQICISLGFLIKELSVYATGLIILQLLLYILVLKTRSKLSVWLVNIFSLPLISLYIMNPGIQTLLHLNNQTSHYTMIALSWMNLRCVSYCLDLIEEKDKHLNILKFMAYCFYLPNLICGPFISYKDSRGCYYYSGDTVRRLRILLMQILRFSFWILFTELCLHFIYVTAISYHLKWIKSFNSWSLYGYGYTMGQFFHLKYLVMYGLATSFAKFENIKVPSLPVCIGRIHLYSDMWKYFDAGLYNFLLRYIYVPSLKNGFVKNRLFSSVLCFIFVFVWHGLQYFILIWTLLNFLGVIIEQFSKFVCEKYIENSKLSKKLGPKWFRRLSCLAASPLLAMSAISNFYFFAGASVGDIFVSRVLKGQISNVVLLVVLYTGCQVSTEVKLRRKTESQSSKVKNT